MRKRRYIAVISVLFGCRPVVPVTEVAVSVTTRLSEPCAGDTGALADAGDCTLGCTDCSNDRLGGGTCRAQPSSLSSDGARIVSGEDARDIEAVIFLRYASPVDFDDAAVVVGGYGAVRALYDTDLTLYAADADGALIPAPSAGVTVAGGDGAQTYSYEDAGMWVSEEHAIIRQEARPLEVRAPPCCAAGPVGQGGWLWLVVALATATTVGEARGRPCGRRR